MIILCVNIRVRSPPSWNSVFGTTWLRFSNWPRFRARTRNPVGPRPVSGLFPDDGFHYINCIWKCHLQNCNYFNGALILEHQHTEQSVPINGRHKQQHAYCKTGMGPVQSIIHELFPETHGFPSQRVTYGSFDFFRYWRPEQISE